ncbi:MAG: SDR family NAD(P)-dependent oxidoreductase, partial [Dehalococcoidia bacterium]|nr:SDR family NAD(P)-dependent oxidoreductase [Dehalococcoidia bacterium]
LLPQMVQRGRGWLVLMASLAGRIAVPDESAYVASKFALVGLGESLAIELEGDGVHVLTVCPGAVRTEFFDEEAQARMPPAARQRMIEPEDVVEAVLKALAEGKHEITLPRSMRPAYLVKAIAPNLMRRMVRRNTIDAVPEPGPPAPER